MEAVKRPVSEATTISVANVEGAEIFNSSHDNNEDGFVRKGLAIGGAAVVVAGLVSWGAVEAASHHSSDPTATTAPVNGPGLKNAITMNKGKDCVTSGELYKNIAETNTPSTEAIFQSLSTSDKNGNQTLVSQTEAVKLMREQVCGSTLALATVTTIQEFRAKLQTPGNNILDLIRNKADSYLVNPTAAIKDEQAAYDFLAFLTPVNNFPITTGNATRLVSANNQKSEIQGQLITGTNNFNGFEVSFDEDNTQLTAEQKAIYGDLQKYVLFNEDGTVVFNNIAANYTVNLQENTPPVNATPNTNNPLVTVGTQPNTTNSNGSSKMNQNNSGHNTGNKVGDTDTQNTAGGGGSSSSGAGSNEGNNSGQSLNNTGVTGSGPGGSGGGGITSTTERGPSSPPTTYYIAPPTTIEIPPTTTAPVTSTTQGSKGAAPTTTICVGSQFNPC